MSHLRAVLAGLDLNAARLRLFALGQRQVQNAVLEAGLALLGVHVIRQAQGPLEAAYAALAVMVALALALDGVAHLAADGQGIALDLDVHALRIHARQVHADLDTVIVLHDVHRRDEVAAGQVVAVEHAPGVAPDGLPQVLEGARGESAALAQRAWIPTCQVSHNTHSFTSLSTTASANVTASFW